MKALLLCVATDGYAALWDFCIESHRAYCKAHGIEYRLVRKCLPGLNAKWSKLQIARDLLAEGYTIMLVDADTRISQSAPHYNSTMTNKRKGIYAALGVSGRPNSGVLMLKGGRSRQAIKFLDACLESRETPVSEENHVTSEGENGHVIEWLQKRPHSGNFQALDGRWNCTRVEGAEGAYIQHFTNFLGKAFKSGAWTPPVVRTIEAASPKECYMCARWDSQRLSRPFLLRSLARDRLTYLRFKKSVRGAAGARHLPPLVQNNPNGWVWRYEFISGTLEMPTLLFLQKLSSSRSIFLNAGARAGYFPLFLRQAPEPPAHVIAIEAHKDNFDVLVQNLDEISSRCFHVALSDRPGTIELIEGLGHSNSTILKGRKSTGRRFTVETATVDDIVARAGHSRIDLMKMDIEGAEPRALIGAAETFAASPDIVVVVESNPQMLGLVGKAPINLADIMQGFGFYGREIKDDFSLGPSGYIPEKGTCNIAFARKPRWKSIYRAIAGRTAA